MKTWGEALFGKKEHKRQMRRVRQSGKKVYCWNCEYEGWDNLDKCSDGPTIMFLNQKAQNWTNAKNNCKHYKRKWWKFWVAQ